MHPHFSDAQNLQTDYLIIGSGAAGMAFADTLFHETEASLLIVDKHHSPGGHWCDAYPFVRLHQPSSYYGVNSRALGGDLRDAHRLNLGMTERATSAELLAYYEAVMQKMVDSGRVKYLPMTEYLGATEGAAEGEKSHQFRALLSGQTGRVRLHKKVVHSAFLSPNVPSTHVRKFTVDAAVPCFPLNDLPKLKTPPSCYVVVGAGKTGIDAVLWLLDNQALPDQICWVMPRDSWFINRANVQAGNDFFIQSFSAMATQFEAVVQATSVADLFQRLESSAQLLRLDPNVEPSMYHAATVSQAELTELRKVKNIVRMGRVQHIAATHIQLQKGKVPLPAGSVVVDCSASIESRGTVPVFQGDTIVPQFIQAHQPTFSAALIAHVEANLPDTPGDEAKNLLCAAVPLPDTPITWLTMQAATMKNRYHWGKNKKIKAWMAQSRLDGFTKMMDAVEEHETEKIAILERLGAAIVPAVMKLQKLITPS